MKHTKSMYPAIGLVATLVLTGCERESTTSSSTLDTPTASTTPSTTVPEFSSPQRPTDAALLEKQLLDLGAKHTDRGLLIPLSSARFDSGETSFEPQVMTRMERLAELLRARPELQVRVIGHTDSRGSTALNERLSLERAQAVQQALIEREHIASRRIYAQGLGESAPLASNATAAGRAENRRVEIFVTDGTGRYASSRLSPPSG